MAGTTPSFSATNFRRNIHFAMNMGLPNVVEERATFRWAPVRSWDKQDPQIQPYSWDAQPTTEVTHDDVQIHVAVDYQRSSGTGGATGTALGEFDTTRAIVTVLDEDYAEIIGATEVLLGGNIYVISFVQVVGLFDVSVYQLHCKARDES